MKKNRYLCVAVVMLALFWSGCGRDTRASVFELEQGKMDNSETVSSQDGAGSQMDQEEWRALLEEAVAALELNPVIQVTCSCTGETQVQQSSVEPSMALGAQDASEADGRVNINTADAAALETLNGIGETRAQAIIAYRESCGGFRTIEDIMQVDGIKEGVFNKIKDQISAG